jgi:hypothetical protein
MSCHELPERLRFVVGFDLARQEKHGFRRILDIRTAAD